MRRLRPPRAFERQIAEWRRRRPPRCPRGWSTGVPDFIGLGVQRAGTTWWHSLLTQHPSIVGARVKELHFFDRESRAADPAVLAREYARHFPRPPGTVAGEWTPYYLHGEHMAAVIRAVVPDARLLVLLRDPVERYRSGAGQRPGMRKRASARGFYATQIERYLRLFPRDQLLVLQYERCLEDPAGQLARSFRFLGVDERFTPARFDRGGARSFGPEVSLTRGRRRRLVGMYEPEVLRLIELGFELDLSLWPNFSHLER